MRVADGISAGSVARRVTRADVARLAGVSAPVVTFVLNGGPKKVSDKTRERVLDAVSQLGYQPDAAARALRRGRSDLIGIIVPSIANPLFASLAHEVEEVASARGLTPMIVSAATNEVGLAVDKLAAHRVDGVLIATPMAAADIAALERSRLSAVLVNQSGAVPGTTTFGVDQYGGARIAVEHLIEQGHEGIAYLGPESGDVRRRSGWADALRSRGLPPGPSIVTTFSRESGYDSGQALLDAHPDVTAAFATSDQIALGALLAFHEAGRSVPGDIALVSFDDSPDAQFAWPPITAVHQPLRRMARDAVERLLAGPTDEHREYEVGLQVRASTRR